MYIQRLRKKIMPMLEGYPMGVYDGLIVHSSSIIVVVNQAAADMFGYEKEEMYGMNSWQLFSPKCVQAIMQHLLEKSEEPYRVTALTKEKTEFELEMKGRDFEVDYEPVRLVLNRQV
jgi:PAS domain S-box-containing protein